MPYAAQTDIEAVFGVKNVEKWADLDHSGAEAAMTARITAALAYADAFIDDELNGGPYAIPVQSPYPVMLVDAAAKIAGFWLYESRGTVDFNPSDDEEPEDRFHWMRKRVMKWLHDIKVGKKRLGDKARTTHVPEAYQHEFTD